MRKAARTMKFAGADLPAGTELTFLTPEEILEFKRGPAGDATLYDYYHDVYGMDLIWWQGKLCWVFRSDWTEIPSSAEAGSGLSKPE